MWILCKSGFYSAVQVAPGPQAVLAARQGFPDHADVLCVRARVKSDLVRLCRSLNLDPGEAILDRGTSGSDYPYRLFIHRDDFALWLGSQVGKIDYFNFKAMVLAVFGYARETIYAQVWARLLQLEQMDALGQEREVSNG